MRQIKSDINAKQGKLNRYFSKCIGAGRAAEVMRHEAYKQLCTIQEECPFEYIRFHGLFHDEMAIAYRDNNGDLRFNFQYLDALFDDMLAAGIRPLVELGLMPEALASKDAHVFWWKMNTSMPKEMSEWYDLVFATVQHCSKRYGEEEVKNGTLRYGTSLISADFSPNLKIRTHTLRFTSRRRGLSRLYVPISVSAVLQQPVQNG